MTEDAWRAVLVTALAVNAALGFGYRAYRLTKGGPMPDVVGQAILGALLGGIAVAVARDVGAARWAALAYGVVFGIAVMPVWTLAVLIPMRPRWPDYAFTAAYWLALGVIVVAAVAL